MQIQMKPKIIEALMGRAIEINADCPEQCRYFAIMTSSMRPDAWILRWLNINIDDLDNPIQTYHYECFHQDGSPQNCGVHYANPQEANAFFNSLIPHYSQEYAGDHKLLAHV